MGQSWHLPPPPFPLPIPSHASLHAFLNPFDHVEGSGKARTNRNRMRSCPARVTSPHAFAHSVHWRGEGEGEGEERRRRSEYGSSAVSTGCGWSEIGPEDGREIGAVLTKGSPCR